MASKQDEFIDNPLTVNRVKRVRAEGGTANPSLDDDPVFPDDGWDYARVSNGSPPCFKCACSRACCEYGLLCRRFGRCGARGCSTPARRKRILAAAVVMNVLSLAVGLAAVAALSTSYSTLRATAWSVGEVNGANATALSEFAGTPITQPATLRLYIGLSGVASQITSVASGDVLSERTDEWDAVTMCARLPEADNFCQQCKSAAMDSVIPAIMSCVTVLPTIQTDIQRMFRKYDLNCQKFLAVFMSGILGTITTLLSWSTFIDGCIRNLPEYPAGATQAAKWQPGVVFVLLIVVTFLKLVDAGVHLLITTPRVIWLARSERKGASKAPTTELTSHPANV